MKNARYGFGETRVARLTLLTFTALSGWRSCGDYKLEKQRKSVETSTAPLSGAGAPVAFALFPTAYAISEDDEVFIHEGATATRVCLIPVSRLEGTQRGRSAHSRGPSSRDIA